MNKQVIYIKQSKRTGDWERITILNNGTSEISLYAYYDKNGNLKKNTFNKYAMIQYLEQARDR